MVFNQASDRPTAMPDLSETLFRPATDAARLVRQKEISARELTEALLARIEAVNPAINAVVELRADEAMEEAAAADRALGGEARTGPLHGVPMTVKDSFNVAGLHTTWGNPEFAEYVAQTDATLVRRLRDAGAIVVGKTNVHFMLADFAQTANELYGVTNNPWDTQRVPGGSSGGGAAALAAGMTFLEYGSDLVGSIRIPGSFCGVYGLKPSVGVVPLTGFQVPGTQPSPAEQTYMSAVGPLARSAADLRTALEATAGPEVPASNAYSWRLAPPRQTRLEEFRVGFVLDHEHAPVSSEVEAPLSRVVEAVSGAGATVREGWPAGVDPVEEAELFGFHVGLFFAFHEQGQVEQAHELVEQETRRLQARAAWGSYFDGVDVFLCPANFTPAFPHDTRPFEQRTISTPEGERPYDNQPFWIAHASLPGLPAVVAPIGRTPSGLPVGAQIIGPLFEDDTPLTFAELLADLIGGYEHPPI
jgi:amidase